MKLKLEQVYAAITAIRIIDKTANPGKESIRLSEKFCEPLFKIIERIETQNRKLVEKYGEKNKRGGFTVPLDSEKWESFINDMNEMLAEEVDIDIELLPLSLIERANLTPAEVRALKILTKQEVKNELEGK